MNKGKPEKKRELEIVQMYAEKRSKTIFAEIVSNKNVRDNRKFRKKTV